MSTKYEMDLTTGSVAKKLLIFAVPLMLSGILQLLYSAFDMIVLGTFSSDESMAAVSSTGSLVNLFVNFFLGLSVGSSVIMAKYYGANDYDNARKTLHTTMLASIIVGVVVTIIGIVFATPMLVLMDATPNLIDRSSLYLQIYFSGIIFNIIYNFGAAILRAIGDTKRPLIYLSIAGVLNILFNLLFVIVFKMDVAGVALGTIISEAVSAILIVVTLFRSEGVLKLVVKELKLDGKIFKDILLVGIPAGLQSVVFNVSNVIIQSRINSFGDLAVAGNGAASSLEGFVYAGMNAVYQATISFTSQNLGAGKFKNIKKTLAYSYLYTIIVSFAIGGLILILPNLFIGLYVKSPEALEFAKERLFIMILTYFLCGFMDCTSGAMRGMGYSTSSMLMTVIGIVGFRITWIYTFFEMNRTLANLYLSYPISWTITWLIELIVYIWIFKRNQNYFQRKFREESLISN